MRKVISVSLILTLLLLAFPAVGLSVEDPNLNLLVNQSLTFNDWYTADRSHADKLITEYSDDLPGLQEQLTQEWQTLTSSLSAIQNKPIVDEDYKYRFYDANQVGKMYVLTLAKDFREKAIKKCVEGIKPSTDDYVDLLAGAKSVQSGFPLPLLKQASSDSYVTADQVKYAVKGLIEKRTETDKYPKIDKTLISELTFYSVPYVLDGTSGIAHTDWLPGREEAICLSALANRPPQNDTFNNVDETVTHNVGHYLHQQFWGPYSTSSLLWAQYTSLFDKSFANGPDWKMMPEENFAEYFRLIFGAVESKNTPYRGGYYAPKSYGWIDSGFEGMVKHIGFNEASAVWNWTTLKINQTLPNGSMDYSVGPDYLGSGKIILSKPSFTFSGVSVPSSANGINLIPVYKFYKDVNSDIKYKRFDMLTPLTQFNAMSGALKYSATINLASPGIYYFEVGALKGNDQYIKLCTIEVRYNPKVDITVTFPDTEKHWASTFISALVSKKILSGFPDGKFWPERPVTRAQFAKMLVDVKGYPKGAPQGYWPDLVPDNWATPYIGAAINNNIIKIDEFPGNNFYPNRPITRQEAALMVAKAFGADTVIKTTDDIWVWGQRNSAKDSKTINSSYLHYVTYCMVNNYMSGYPDGSFYPDKTLTRAEATVLMSNLLK
ncbi:MAG: S-layer homology domain-containing protein [Acidobacteriota bacterium]